MALIDSPRSSLPSVEDERNHTSVTSLTEEKLTPNRKAASPFSFFVSRLRIACRLQHGVAHFANNDLIDHRRAHQYATFRLLPSEHPYIDLRYPFADCGARENTCACHVTRRRGHRV